MEAVQWIMSVGTNIYEAIQLNDELSRLRTSLPKAHLLIDRAEWGSFKNKHLAVLLSQLKDTTYDAEDLLRDFDYQVLRQRMEDTDRSRAGQLLTSSFNLFKIWISGSKTRVKEAQSNLDKVVADIEGVLNFMGLNVEPAKLGKQLMPETSSVMGVPEVFGRDEERDLVIERLGVTIGRDNERDRVIELLGVPLTRGSRSARAAGKRAALGMGVASKSRAKRLRGESSRGGIAVSTKTNCTGNVSVLPIVGIGGVGKTTLAQFIYNDERVKHHFDVMSWVCVSDLFDKRKITKEIIESIAGEGFNSSGSLKALQMELKEQLMGQKFLLVLDDVWPIANDEWEAFYAPLRHGLEGSMVLVTTRFPKVADLVTITKPVQLEGLPTDIFWEFFKKCAFGKQHPESYPQLQDIGQSIADRLCGSPLAAKTLGRLLNMELTERHWRTIQNSELWELPHQENEILPALQLSYLYLPQELKRCFAVCSMFPKDYSFGRDEIVEFWVAQGFVAAGGSTLLEDMGCRYLDDLRSRFLFQTDPKFPERSRYVMHDLIHDMAQSVSVGECFLMQDSSSQNQRIMPQTVRHMSIEMDSEALSRLTGLDHVNKLHSLRFRPRFKVEISWFNQLSNILFLSLKGCKLIKLPEGLCVLTHLRHLDISHSSIKELPEKLWCLYSLQVFYASRSSLQTIQQDVTKLVNLRRLTLPVKASEKLSRINGLGNLSSLRNLSCFMVGTENGRRIDELKGMNLLSGTLCIKGIAKVQNKEEAAGARLVDKQYLKALVLEWRVHRCAFRSAENEILEALCPPPGIERLKVHRFAGDVSPSWLQPKSLPTLRFLELFHCCFKYLSIPLPSLEELVLHVVEIEALTSINSSSGIEHLPLIGLTTLRLVGCNKLTNLDQFLSPEYLPSIKSIELNQCSSLVSLPVYSFDDRMQHASNSSSNGIACLAFTGLATLRLANCYKLTNIDQFLSPGYLPSIKSIELVGCSSLVSLPVHNFDDRMQHASNSSSNGIARLAFTSLTTLHLGCEKLTNLDQFLSPEYLPSIKSIELVFCSSLVSLPVHNFDDMISIISSNGIARLAFTSLTTLRLVNCFKLRNLDQFLSPEYLPSIKSIVLQCCQNLVSLPVHNFGGFVCLQDLKIHQCVSLVCQSEMVLPHSLQRLSIWCCGELDKSFRPGCFENLASLTLLHLEDCPNVESIPLSSINTNNLKFLGLRDCPELSSIGGSDAFSCIQHVDIRRCPMLTEVQQPLEKKGLRPKEEKELLQFVNKWS